MAKRKTASLPVGGSATKSTKTATRETVGSDFADLDAYGFGSDGRPSRDAALSWRLDEADSLSDWTITVTRAHREHASTTTGEGQGRAKAPLSPAAARQYHVHKNILAVGRKRSEYFVGLFRSQDQLAELIDATSYIELEGSAADAFPVMLDYLYYTDPDDVKFGATNITVENVVALRHLAQYFRIRELFDVATDRLHSDLLSGDLGRNSLTFILEATIYGDERLANAAIDVCAEKLGNIAGKDFQKLPPNLFVKILSSAKLSDKQSIHLSWIVAHYCEAHSDEDEIDEDLFVIMTDETIMPEVDEKAALLLLKFLTGLILSPKNNAAMKNLKARCMGMISSTWANVADAKAKKSEEEGSNLKDPRSDKVKEDGSGLPNDLQIELLGSCLQKAKKDLDDAHETIKNNERTIVNLREQIGRVSSRPYRVRLSRPDPQVLDRRQEHFL